MPNTPVEYTRGGTTGGAVLQNEEYVSNCTAGTCTVRASGELRGGEGMGGFVDENLSDKCESAGEVSSLCVY